MEPLGVVRAWIAAFARGDLEEARGLYAEDGVLHTWHPPELAGDHLGFDEALRWFQRKGAAEGQAFTYGIEELMGGDRHAVALFLLSTNGRDWRQAAVYRIDAGKIAEIWLYEEPH